MARDHFGGDFSCSLKIVGRAGRDPRNRRSTPPRRVCYLRTVRRFSKSWRVSKKRILCSVFAWCSRRPTPRGMSDTLCTGWMPDSLGVPPCLLAATSLQDGHSTGGSLLFEGGVSPGRTASRDRPTISIQLSYACDDLVRSLLIQQSDGRYGRHAHTSAADQRSGSSSRLIPKGLAVENLPNGVLAVSVGSLFELGSGSGPTPTLAKRQARHAGSRSC
jgi:hypothetical protein